jgi:hypothetical protein
MREHWGAGHQHDSHEKDAGHDEYAVLAEVSDWQNRALEPMCPDLPPEAPSFITRVCGFRFHIPWFQFQQAGRVRSPQIVQVLDVFQRVFGFQVMSAV